MVCLIIKRKKQLFIKIIKSPSPKASQRQNGDFRPGGIPATLVVGVGARWRVGTDSVTEHPGDKSHTSYFNRKHFL